MCVEQNIIKQQRLHPRMKLKTVCVGSTQFFHSETQHWIDMARSNLFLTRQKLCKYMWSPCKKTHSKVKQMWGISISKLFFTLTSYCLFFNHGWAPIFPKQVNSFFFSLKRVSSFLLNLGLSNSFLQQNVSASGYESRSYTAVVLFKQGFCFPTLTCDCCY